MSRPRLGRLGHGHTRRRPGPGRGWSALRALGGALGLAILAGAVACDSRHSAPESPPDPIAAPRTIREVLEALGLDRPASQIPSRVPGARLVSVTPEAERSARANGLLVQEMSVPARQGSGAPRTPVDILRTELADTDRFQLLYSPRGTLNAIIPAPASDGSKPSGWFMDLTPYTVDIERMINASEGDLVAMARRIVDERDRVAGYLRSVGMSTRLRPVDQQAKKPYVLVTLDSKTGTIDLEEFGPADLLEDAPRHALFEKVTSGGPARRMVYPVFPTVYSPAIPHNRDQARNMGGHVHRQLQQIRPRDGDPILDVGTGSGYLSWVAYATARDMGRSVRIFAIDINPLAVANARVLARIAGYALQAEVHDNVVDPDGTLAFPGQSFRLIIWDMPALPRLLGPHLRTPVSGSETQHLMTYWDDGRGAIESLQRLAGALPRLLAASPESISGEDRTPPSTAVLWNALPDDMPDFIDRTFHAAGLRTRLLDTYSSGHGAVRCVVLGISTQSR